MKPLDENMVAYLKKQFSSFCFKCTLLFIIFLFLPVSVKAGVYHSKFGFSIILPSNWLIISSDTLQNNPKIFDFDNPKLSLMDRNFKEQIESVVKSGNMEFYVNKATANNVCLDGITVTIGSGDFPETNEELESWKKNMPILLSKKMDMRIEFHKLELRRINGLKMLFTEYSAKDADLYFVQYAVQKSPKATIALTGTFYVKNFDKMQLELTNIMESFGFDQLPSSSGQPQ